ncbi:MAG: RIP metalloprotease RseP [Candidatus Marinimicrobia bacterium]|nr:RIP metalloprotease RseP [Candidatus Neomarinimicrobiota bacterium]
MITLLATALVIGIIVFVHELGHYLAARSVGVRVEKFSVGFPPRIITMKSVPDGWDFKLFFFRKAEDGRRKWAPIIEKHLSRQGRKGTLTEYCFALIPLGGYVKMAGLIDESLDSEIEHRPYELMSKPRLAQAWVMSAGVIMNVILALAIYTGIAYNQGNPVISDEPVIAQILEGQPAEAVGMQVGDKITEINGEPIETWEELATIIHAIPNTPINIHYEHEGIIIEKDLVTSFQPALIDGKIDTLGAIGIATKVTYEPINFFQAIEVGWQATKGIFGLIGTTLKMLITGAATMKDIGGPIFIAQMAGETARAGVGPLLFLMAMISINLAVINILPIPGLDGGHLLVIGIESIIRRSLSLKVKIVIQKVGMAFLLTLMVFVIYNDIHRVFTN